MTKRRWRLPLTALLLLAAASTALAQRGGGYRQSYSNNTRYDGKFVFVRMSYPTNTFRNPGWAHDYPTGEVHFMKILTSVSNVPAHVEETNILDFGDPEMFKFPLIYLVEPGMWTMTEDQSKALRAYLTKGGFMIVDDFPDWAWPQFDLQMSAVFPEGRWIDLEDASHPIWHSFFEISSLDLIPQAYNLGGPPRFRALFEDNDPTKRMMVIANYQSDLSEFWEFSEVGVYPIDASNEAYKLGVNEFIYGMTH
jgi:hypothetical protein